MKRDGVALRNWKIRTAQTMIEKRKKAQQLARNTPKTASASKQVVGQRKAIKKKGKRTLEWEKARHEVKSEFQARGIEWCELGVKGCWFDTGLTFAHRCKRRFITTPIELRRVALLCLPCHGAVEKLPHKEMFDIITAVIQKREGYLIPALNES